MPKNGNGSAVEDTPRNRCLEFIKYLVRWENSNNPEYIDPARKLIAAAHKFLHPGAEGDAPKVLDPFAGGGAIPLEALRLGCEAHAIDINPVAHLIELCTLVYPQKYGQPDSRPVPDYIKRLVAHNRAKKKMKGEGRAAARCSRAARIAGCCHRGRDHPRCRDHRGRVSEESIGGGREVLGALGAQNEQRDKLTPFYPVIEGQARPIAYLWARTVACPNPACNAVVPLVRQLWLSKKSARKIALQLIPNETTKACDFRAVEDSDISFDPNRGTMQLGKATCPFCAMVADGTYLRQRAMSGKMGLQLLTAVVLDSRGKKRYITTDTSQGIPQSTVTAFLASVVGKNCYGNLSWIPVEAVPDERPAPNSRGLSGVARYGANDFSKLFSARQLASLVVYVQGVRAAVAEAERQHGDNQYATAIGTLLAFFVSKLADRNSANCIWIPQTEALGHSFSRQALQMVWDFLEINPLYAEWGWLHAVEEIIANINSLRQVDAGGKGVMCQQASAAALPYERRSFDLIATDPPYYESVPYGDLSDFFYVWLRRGVGDRIGNAMRTPLTPKSAEIIAYYGGGKRKVQKPPEWYEAEMGKAFGEMRRTMDESGVTFVMFAHKTTAAWETLISPLLSSKLIVTASWPLHTERMARMVAQGTASLAGSITLICRPRTTIEAGLWDDVRQELRAVAQERLDFFWSQGIRGADFFISAIGPALSVFGKYERVTKLSGEEVTVGQFLDEVRSLVSNYALTKILKTSQTASIDPESRFYVVWKWSYADAKVHADESFKLSQALGMPTEMMWDRTGTLEKSGENVQTMPIAKRMKIKDLGDPSADGSPGSLIDVLHRLCVFREKNDTDGMVQFLARSGQANNPALWIVAQAVSEILPDGDKEKQLMQGLLNQKEKIEQAGQQGRMF